MKTPDRLLAAVRKALRKGDYDPMVEWAKDIDGMERGHPSRIAFFAEFSKYVHAKPAAVDGEGNVAPVLKIEIASFAAAPMKALKSAKPEDDD